MLDDVEAGKEDVPARLVHSCELVASRPASHRVLLVWRDKAHWTTPAERPPGRALGTTSDGQRLLRATSIDSAAEGC